MNLDESGFIVATLLIALIALLLVLAARRDAQVVRDNARTDADHLIASAERRDKESRDRESRLDERERQLDEARDTIATEQRDIAEQRERLDRDRKEHQSQLSAQHRQLTAELERVSGLTADQATLQLREQIAADNDAYVRTALRERELLTRTKADAQARRIIADAMSRLAVPVSTQIAQEAVELPAPEFRGRIIGKEGRNIRTFEALTGVDVILDDDSSSVVLSSFDAERRDVAVTAMKELIADGRIHPGRIEEVVAGARESMSSRTLNVGYDAVKAAGVGPLPTELVATIGRLRFRTSYAQNVLDHCVETALIAGAIADELGADAAVARRAGLLHDIGKLMTAAQPGSHAKLGAQLIRDYGESEDVAHAVRAHHGEEEFRTVEAVIVQIADSISAARPGARRDDLSSYVERVTQLEDVVTAHEGVAHAYVVSSGHEIRVVVEPERVTDDDLHVLAGTIADAVQQHTTFPGEVAITVIRETRATSRAG